MFDPHSQHEEPARGHDRPNLLTLCDRTFVINLPERTDRRRQTEAELRRHFPGEMVDERVTFYEAIKPSGAGPFENAGVHGAFRSSLDILRMSSRDGLDSILVLQDDVRLAPAYQKREAWLMEELGSQDWSYATLGYIDTLGVTKQYEGQVPVMWTLQARSWERSVSRSDAGCLLR